MKQLKDGDTYYKLEQYAYNDIKGRYEDTPEDIMVFADKELAMKYIAKKERNNHNHDDIDIDAYADISYKSIAFELESKMYLIMREVYHDTFAITDLEKDL